MARSRPRHKKTQDPAPFTVGGRRVVLEALRSSRRVVALYMTDALSHWSQYRELIQLAESARVRIVKKTEKDLDQLVGGTRHQGVVAEVRDFPEIDLDTLLEQAPQQNLIALDQVQDPMNLGAILRSANVCGLPAVICPKYRSASLTQVAVRASAGAALHTPICFVTNLARSLDALKEAGYQVLVLDAAEDSVVIRDVEVHSPWVLVAGSEGKGLRRLVRSKADVVIQLPVRGAVESLNVSNACAVALFMLTDSAH